MDIWVPRVELEGTRHCSGGVILHELIERTTGPLENCQDDLHDEVRHTSIEAYIRHVSGKQAQRGQS